METQTEEQKEKRMKNDKFEEKSENESLRKVEF